MNIFLQNYCRICSSFFCCEKCRLNHEIEDHKIHPECNICIYGKALLKKPSESLLQHLIKTHLPLHCLHCRKVFTSSEALLQHATCTKKQKLHNQETPDMIVTSISAVESNYDSPPITAIMHKSILTSSNKNLGVHNNTVSLTTSTPLQKFSEQEMLENIPEVITPVDYSENTNISNKYHLSGTKKAYKTPINSEQSKNTEPPLKRRVTFCETPIINQDGDQSKRTKNIVAYGITSSAAVNDEISSDNENMANLNVKDKNDTADDKGNTMYLTMDKEDAEAAGCYKTKEASENNYNHISEVYCTNSNETTNNDTMWESALMDQNLTKSDISFVTDDQSLTSDNIFPTPKSSDIPTSKILSNLSHLENSSPIVNECLKKENISYLSNQDIHDSLTLPPITESKLSNLDILPLKLDQNSIKIEASFSEADEYSVISDIECSIINSHSIKSENVDISNIESYSTDSMQVYTMEDVTCNTSRTLSKQGLWSSMTNIVKTMVQGLSGSSSASHDLIRYEKKKCGESYKRAKPENDDISGDGNPIKKRIKLMDIRCRRSIRNIRPLQHIRYDRKRATYVDKWTQTD